MIYAILFTLFVLLVIATADFLGKITLLQSIEPFEIINNHAVKVLLMYYGFIFYVIVRSDICASCKIKILFARNKLLLFVSLLCYCIEECLEKCSELQSESENNVESFEFEEVTVKSNRHNIYNRIAQDLALA